MADKTDKPWMDIGETDDPEAVIESFVTAASCMKGDPVYLSADDKVSPATSAQECVGVATQDTFAGNLCPVLTKGRIKVKAGGAIARGKAVYGADAQKRVLVLADQPVNEGGSATYSIYYNRKLGTALETATAADDLIFIEVER